MRSPCKFLKFFFPFTIPEEVGYIGWCRYKMTIAPLAQVSE
jgi:hypothetical protein